MVGDMVDVKSTVTKYADQDVIDGIVKGSGRREVVLWY